MNNRDEIIEEYMMKFRGSVSSHLIITASDSLKSDIAKKMDLALKSGDPIGDDDIVDLIDKERL